MREAILKAIRDEPGLGVRDLVNRTHHAGATVVKHLAQLRESGRVIAAKDGSRLRHWLPGEASLTVGVPLGTDAILAALQEAPATFAALRQRLPDVGRSTLQYRLKRLEEAGDIKRDSSRPLIFHAVPTAD